MLLSACSLKSVALRGTAELIRNGIGAFYEESDVQLAEESMASQIKLLEVLLKNDPSNPDLLLLCSQGFGAYAFLFVEEKDPGRARGFYERGRDFGLAYLKKRTGTNFLTEPDLSVLGKKLQTLEVKDVPILFWTVYCWGGASNLSRDDPDAVASLPKIEKMMVRVDEISPGYFYGGADIFLGSYYGSRPKIFGGNLEKSKFHFDRGLKFTGGKFLMGWVLYAQYYAVPAQDREIFKELLSKVLSSDSNPLPEQRLSNAVAKIKAQKLMEKINELF